MYLHRFQYGIRYILSIDLKRDAHVERRTVYTKCVYTVAITAIDTYFPLTLKRDTKVATGTVYTKWVYTGLVFGLDATSLFAMKRL